MLNGDGKNKLDPDMFSFKNTYFHILDLIKKPQKISAKQLCSTQWNASQEFHSEGN